MSNEYEHGLFNFATHVASDRANALVWCAADGGRRIKAFRSSSADPVNNLAGCNKAREQGEGNGIPLQYTLCSEAGPALSKRARHAGLHVMGTRVICVKGRC